MQVSFEKWQIKAEYFWVYLLLLQFLVLINLAGVLWEKKFTQFW